MDKEWIAIQGVGICTAGIRNVEDLCDQMIGQGEVYERRQKKLENAVQNALEEANAIGQPVLWVRAEQSPTTSLYQALEQVKDMDHAAIICTQTNGDGLTEAAVLLASTIKEEKAWAQIVELTQGEGEKPTFLNIYKSRGPVQEAGELILATIELRYGLQMRETSQDGWLWNDDGSDNRRIAIHGGVICLEEAEALMDCSVMIKKQLIPVSFSIKEEGIQKLGNLLSISERLSLTDLGKNTRKGFLQSRRRKRTVVFAAKEKETLQSEVKAFLSVQEKWDNPGYVWRTMEGSFYTADPLRGAHRIAILSPPFGMFSKLRFYRLYRALPTLKQHKEEACIRREGKGLLMRRYCAEALSRSMVLQAIRELGIPFDLAAGVGAGETYLPFILDSVVPESSITEVYEELLENQEKLEKEYYETIPEGELENWYLVCDKDAVEQAIELVGEGEVFLSLIGSRNEVMICGRGLACSRVIEQLGTYGVKAEEAIYTNTPVLEAWKEKIHSTIENKGMHRKEEMECHIYSSSLHQRLGSSTEMFAEAVTESMVSKADMPRLLEALYSQGCRVFIDISSGRICNKWVRDTFRNRKELLVTSFFEEAAPEDSLPFLLAQFMSYGVRIRYDQFYKKLNWEENDPKDVRTQLLEQLLECNQDTLSSYRIREDHVPCRTAEIKASGQIPARSCSYRKREINEMSNGSMSNILGAKYRGIDQYEKRMRLPKPPFLFVSRIVRIAAEYGSLKDGSYIEGEFAVTEDTMLLINKRLVSNTVLAEAGQIGIFLAAYMGIDEDFKGRAKYHIIDVTQEFYGGYWPKVGDTVRLCFSFDRIIKNEDRIMFFSTYDVEFRGKPLMQFKHMGAITSREEELLREGIKETEKPEVMLAERCQLYHPLTGRHQFSKEQIRSFLYGKLSDCFGENVASTPLMYWSGEEACLVDRILDISSEGGSYGYGYVFGEKEIEEEFWAFSSYVKNDPSLPNTLLEEMVVQVITFFECYMGLHDPQKEMVPELVKNHPNRSRFGAEVRPGHHIMIIKAEPRVVKKIQDRILVIYDGAVYCDGVQTLKQEGVASFIR